MTFPPQMENNKMIPPIVDNEPNAKTIFPAIDDRPEIMIFKMASNKPIAEMICSVGNDRPEKTIFLMAGNEPAAKMISPASDDRPEKMISPEDFAFLRADATPTTR